MDLITAVKTCFSKYIVFNGRATRPEYWWWTLFVIIVSIVLTFVDIAVFDMGSTGVGLLSTLFSLAIFLPGLGVTVRRLHDINKSGWWFLIILVPILGFLILLYWLTKASDQGSNNYG